VRFEGTLKLKGREIRLKGEKEFTDIIREINAMIEG